MKMTLRWYGEKDSIPLKYIKQIPNVSGVVSAIYDVPVGEVAQRNYHVFGQSRRRAV